MKNNLKKSELIISPEFGVYSNLYKDIYFDKKHGIKETQHNFIKANNLASRFKNSDKFIISELGFGTGLSFLLTLKLWKETKKPNAKLIYISFESAPLTKIELNNVYKKVSGVKILFNQLIKKLNLFLWNCYQELQELNQWTFCLHNLIWLDIEQLLIVLQNLKKLCL